MANEGMLREKRFKRDPEGGANLREQRESVDTGTGSKRLAGGRSSHIGQGQFVNFYKDLGISTTEPHATALREEEAQFQDALSKDLAKLNEARNQYNADMARYGEANKSIDDAAGSLPGISAAVQDSWNQHTGQLTKVRIMGPNNTVETTHLLPREAADSFINKRGIFATRVNDEYLNVQAKNYRNAELREVIAANEASYKAQYLNQATAKIGDQLVGASSDIAEGRDYLAQSKGVLDANKAAIDNMSAQIDAAKADREAYWQTFYDQQQRRRDSLAALIEEM